MRGFEALEAHTARRPIGQAAADLMALPQMFLRFQASMKILLTRRRANGQYVLLLLKDRHLSMRA